MLFVLNSLQILKEFSPLEAKIRLSSNGRESKREAFRFDKKQYIGKSMNLKNTSRAI